VPDASALAGRAPDTLRPAVEAILQNRFGGRVRLDSGVPFEAGSRAQVYRFTILDGVAGLPATVIAKRAAGRGGKTYDPDDPTGPAWWLFNEWAGLQFLDALGGERPPAARFYGGDRAAGVVALEDMGVAAHLHTFVLGSDPAAAETALIGLATTLGRMHALAADKTGEYRRLRDALGPANPEALLDGYDWLAPAFDGMAAALGITPAPGTGTDLAALRAALRDPGPFLTYLHGDPCLDNCLQTPAGVRLFDFEVGCAGPALTDGVYGGCGSRPAGVSGSYLPPSRYAWRRPIAPNWCAAVPRPPTIRCSTTRWPRRVRSGFCAWARSSSLPAHWNRIMSGASPRAASASCCACRW
jgi:Phosphotransferase enzyme family